MESTSSPRRRRFSDINRKNGVIERKYECEIRRYDKERANMLSNHLHDTIKLIDTIKLVKRSSGQADKDIEEEVLTLVASGNVHDTARSATKWRYCTNYDYNDWNELDASDFWTRRRRPHTAHVDAGKTSVMHTKPAQPNPSQRDLSLNRPKTVAPVLNTRNQMKRVTHQSRHKNYVENETPRNDQQQKVMVKIGDISKLNLYKERVPLDINSKIFKLAHGLIKTPRLRRWYKRESSVSEESCSSSSESDNGYDDTKPQRLKRRNSGFLSSVDMYQEARKTSSGNEETTALFRLAIERQRRLSVAPNEYKDWSLQAGIDLQNPSDKGNSDSVDSTKMAGSEKLDVPPGISGPETSSEPHIAISGDRKDESTILDLDLKNDRESSLHDKGKDFYSKTDKYYENTRFAKGTDDSSAHNREIMSEKKIASESNSPDSAALPRDNGRKQTRNIKQTRTAISKAESELSKENKVNSAVSEEHKAATKETLQRNIALEEPKSQKHGQSKITDAFVPPVQPDVCQNVSASALLELKKIEEEKNIFSSDDEDENVKNTMHNNKRDETTDTDDSDKEKNLKKELELVHRRLQFSKFDSKKFALKSYVKPHLRYKTERMYLVRKRNLLHRQIALASQENIHPEWALSVPDQRFTLQNQVVSSNKQWRERKLNQLINSNNTQQQADKRNSVRTVSREKINQFLESVSSFIEPKKNSDLFA